MTRKQTTARIIAASILALATGCASTPKKPTIQQAAKVQWNNERSTIMITLATDQYQAGQFDKARETITDAIKLAPQSAQARVVSAKIAIEQSQLEVADRELRLAREFDPKNPEADYLAGVVCQRWQKADLAYECYTRASEKAPSQLAYLLARAEALVAMDRTDEALKLLQNRVVYFEHSAAIRDAVGQLLLQEKKYSEAVGMLREASVLTPDDLTVREHLGMALFYAKQYDESAAVLSRLATQEKFAGRSDIQAALGECYDQLGRYRDARIAYEAATKLDSGSANLWLGLGKAALQLGDTRRAELSVKKAIALDPDGVEANMFLGYVRLKKERFGEALAAFQHVTAVSPSDAVGMCMTGYCLQKMGRTDEAIRSYARALQAHPNDEMAKQLMAGVDTRE